MSARSVVDPARDRTDAPASPVYKPIPFKPRRALFVILALINLLWIGALVAMYFKTAHDRPRETHPAGDTERVQRELQRELDELTATTRPGAEGSPSAPR
jgi:hypothetical protein